MEDRKMRVAHVAEGANATWEVFAHLSIRIL
jgi:hypothetical protein